MPINFSLSNFTSVTDVFCETGTFKGAGTIKAIEAGFSKIATVEISEANQNIARKNISAHKTKNLTMEFILGDAEQKISELIDFAVQNKSEHPVFWLDAHTHCFEDGTKTQGNPCPLITEITAIHEAFGGDAILLIDDMRIIGAKLKAPQGMKNRVRFALNSLTNPEKVLSNLKPGWGNKIDALTLIQLVSEPTDVSFKLLDGVIPMDVLCAYPGKLHQNIFG